VLPTIRWHRGVKNEVILIILFSGIHVKRCSITTPHEQPACPRCVSAVWLHKLGSELAKSVGCTSGGCRFEAPLVLNRGLTHISSSGWGITSPPTSWFPDRNPRYLSGRRTTALPLKRSSPRPSRTTRRYTEKRKGTEGESPQAEASPLALTDSVLQSQPGPHLLEIDHPRQGDPGVQVCAMAGVDRPGVQGLHVLQGSL
jgi:hypothetical protein